MMETKFWLIRHAIVAENERAQLYGIRDVQLCPESLLAQAPMYRAARDPAAAARRMGLHPAVTHAPHGGGDLRGRLSASKNCSSNPG